MAKSTNLIALLCLFLGAGSASALSFRIDGNPTAETVTAILFNEYIGPQEHDVSIVNAPVAWWAGRSSPSAFPDCADYAGKVLVMDSGTRQWRYSKEFRAFNLAADCGAVAVVRLLEPDFLADREFLGFRYRTRDHDCCRGSSTPGIPILTSWHADFNSIEAALGSGSDVTMNITRIDVNPWVSEYFKSTFFNVALRGVIGFANLAVGCLAFRGVVLRSFRLYAAHTTNTETSLSSKLLFIGVIMEFCASFLRVIYCAFGPLVMNGFFTFEAHMYMGNISAPLQIVSITIAVLVMQQVGAFRKLSARNLRITHYTAVFVVVLAFVLGLLTAHLTASTISFKSQFATALATTMIIGTASVVFLYFGMKFLKQLGGDVNGTEATNRNRRNRKRRFTFWIMSGAVAKLAEVSIGSVFVLVPGFGYSPIGMASTYTMYMAAFTAASLCHVIAFTPDKPAKGKLHRADSDLDSPEPPRRVNRAVSILRAAKQSVSKAWLSVSHAHTVTQSAPVVLYPTETKAVEEEAHTPTDTAQMV